MCTEGKRLLITKKKVIKKVKTNKFDEEEEDLDPGIDELKTMFKNASSVASGVFHLGSQKKKKKKEDLPGVENEKKLEEETEGPNSKYNLKEIIISPVLSDITAFTFGGFSSRFLMLRKHVNS